MRTRTALLFLPVAAILLLVSLDEPPSSEPIETATETAAITQPQEIMYSDFEVGLEEDWDLIVSEGACPDLPLCPDSNPAEECDWQGCECVTECQVDRDPPCNLRAALCF